MKVFDSYEILLQRFYENFRNLYASKIDAQNALSRCGYSMRPDVESGELFLILDTMPERLGEVTNNIDNYLKAAKHCGGFDGVWLHVQMKPFKLLRF